MNKRANKIKFRGVTIREGMNVSGTVSFRVECLLAWFIGRRFFGNSRNSKFGIPNA
jgi:hypothetical protein